MWSINRTCVPSSIQLEPAEGRLACFPKVPKCKCLTSWSLFFVFCFCFFFVCLFFFACYNSHDGRFPLNTGRLDTEFFALRLTRDFCQVLFCSCSLKFYIFVFSHHIQNKLNGLILLSLFLLLLNSRGTIKYTRAVFNPPSSPVNGRYFHS